MHKMYAHVITYLHAYISHACTEESGQLVFLEVLALD